MGIKFKIIISITMVLLVSSIVLLNLVKHSYHDTVQNIGEENLKNAKQSFKQLEASDANMLSGMQVLILNNEEIIKAYQNRNLEKLLQLTIPIYKQLNKHHGVTHLNFIQPPPANTIFARLSKPELFGDTIKRITYINSTKTESVSYGMEVGKTGFVLRVLTPIKRNEEIIGYLELGVDIDRFFSLLKIHTDNDVALVLDKKHIDAKEWASTCSAKKLRNNWNDFTNILIVSNTLYDAAFIPKDLNIDSIPEDGIILGVMTKDSTVIQRSLFPIRDEYGKNIGFAVILKDITTIDKLLRENKTEMMIFIIILLLILCILVIWLMYNLVFRRIKKMIDNIERAAGGDLKIQPQSYDEIGKSEEKILNIIKNLSGKGN